MDRYDFADAILTFASYRDDTLISRLARKDSRVSALSNMGWPHKRSRRGRRYETTERQAVEGLEPGAALLYLALVAKHSGESEALKLANDIHRKNSVDGVTIHLETSDDDPTQFTAHIHDELADEWCEAHGSLDGGTWECADGPEFCYDILYWRAGLIEDLQKEGFDFDFSSFSEPEPRDLEIAKHASECSECEYDWHKGEEHYDTLYPRWEVREKETAKVLFTGLESDARDFYRTGYWSRWDLVQLAPHNEACEVAS